MIFKENEHYTLSGLEAGSNGAGVFTIAETGKIVAVTYNKRISEEVFDFLTKRKESFEKIKFTRVKRDVNGNPRYVCHYRAFRSENSSYISYEDALKQAKKIGGKKYSRKDFPGGIVFQSYNIAETERLIKENRI